MNEPILSQTITLTDAHVDRFGRMKPSAILLCIQEISGRHSKLLGAGQGELTKKGLFWAILRSRLAITRLPRVGQTIRLETWPMPTTRVAYPRACAAYDEAGNELFRAITIWVLMDAASRALVLPGKSGVEVCGRLLGSELPVPAGLTPKPMGRSHERRVCFTDLDRNGHMNNTRYLDWIWDLLPSEFHRLHTPRDITLCYLSEAREGQTLALKWELPQEDTLQVEIHRQPEGERSFGARILFAPDIL